MLNDYQLLTIPKSLPADGKAFSPLVGKHIPCWWESIFPAGGKVSSLILGMCLPRCRERRTRHKGKEAPAMGQFVFIFFSKCLRSAFASKFTKRMIIINTKAVPYAMGSCASRSVPLVEMTYRW